MSGPTRPTRDDWARLRLDKLEEQYAECELCPDLVDTGWWTRNNIVFGEGMANADVLFVGIAPGQREDAAGLPFVGPTGQLLDDMLMHMVPHEDLKPFYNTRKNITGEQWRTIRHTLCRTERFCYTNAVLCRPVKQEWDDRREVMRLQNRDPTLVECKNCSDRLRRTVLITDPILVVSLGAPALHSLLALDTKWKGSRPSVLEMTGSVFDLHLEGEVTTVRYPLLVLPHPAYLLRFWDIDDPTGWVQRVVKHLKQGLRIVDLTRNTLYRTPIPKRK
jgi:uracil-DNA glycosylase family 4